MPRFDAQGILGLAIHLWGIYLIATAIVIIPSCNWENISVCPTTKLGDSSNVSPCMDFGTQAAVNDWSWYFWNLGQQYGFITGAPVSPLCRLYACTGCIRTTTACETGNSIYSCEASRSTGDIDPLSPFVYIGFILFGAILFFTNRDLLPTKRTLFSLVIVVAGVYIVEQSIAFKDTCPNSEMTPNVCGGALAGQVKNDKVVQLQYCGVPGYSPFATNVPYSPNAVSCIQHGCPPRSCLKTSATCPTLTDITYECVAPGVLAAAQPVNLFIGILFIVVGALVWFLRDKSEDGLKYKYEEVA